MNTIMLLLASTTELPSSMLALGAIVTFALGMAAGILLMRSVMRRKPEQDDLAPWRHDRTEH